MVFAYLQQERELRKGSRKGSRQVKTDEEEDAIAKGWDPAKST